MTPAPAEKKEIARAAGGFGRDRTGVVAIFVALVMPVIAGFATLSIDMGYLLQAKSRLQTAADAAALGAASAVDGTDAGETTAATRAVALAAANSPSSAGTVLSSGDVVFGIWDSATSTFTTSSDSSTVNAVRVTTRRSTANGNPVNLFFAKIMGIATKDVTATAIATQVGTGSACVLALDSTASGALEASGSANVTFNGCDVAANSNSATGLDLKGFATLSANCASVVGSTNDTAPKLNLTCGSARTGTSAITDPYADLPSPTIGACLDDQLKVLASTTISPGTYCRGIDVAAGATLTLESGVYIIDRGDFRINGGATVQATGGVTIILTTSTGSDVATVTVNGGATVTLAAQTSGDYAGVVFFQDTETNTDNKFLGGSTMNITGALYFPAGEVSFTGGNEIGGATCTQIVANTIEFQGNAVVNSTCAGTGVQTITTTWTYRLVQ